MKICAHLLQLFDCAGTPVLNFRSPARRPPGPADAEAVAIAALGFLAADPERLSRFLAISGLDVAHLRSAAAEEGFLAGILAYLAADESLLLEFAAASGRAPEAIAAANLALNPGFEG
jgi:hypothetical protein